MSGHRRTLLSVVAGILLGILLIRFDVDLPAALPGFLLQFTAACLLSIAIHEIGHALAGMLNGFRILVFAAGPLELRREGQGWKVAWSITSLVKGFIAPDPVRPDNLRRRLFWMVLGGPGASVLVGSTALLLAVRMGEHWPDWVTALCAEIALWSFLFALTGLVPIRTRNLTHDGQRLLMLLRGGPEADRFCALSLLAPSVASEMRPREWSAEYVLAASALKDGTPDSAAALGLYYNWLLDVGQLEKAGEVLDTLVRYEMPDEARAIWGLEAAWYEARHRLNAGRARAGIDATGSRPSTPATRCARAKATAGVAWLERRWPDAEVAAQAALRECDSLGNSGSMQALREELNTLLEEVRIVGGRDSTTL